MSDFLFFLLCLIFATVIVLFPLLFEMAVVIPKDW